MLLCRLSHFLQDIPSSVLTMLYMLETARPPSTLVLLSFATSLTYLGCAGARCSLRYA